MTDISRRHFLRAGAAAGLAIPALALGASRSSWAAEEAGPRTFEARATETLAVARMNHGDTLRFTLANGETRVFELEDTVMRIVERIPRGIVYSFEARFLADGQPVTLRRFVCSQESFYEPWVINGVRLWLSSSAAIFEQVPIRYPEGRDNLEEDAIIAVQDATLPICPQRLTTWYANEDHFIDVGDCYNGDDPWLGPYLGEACHMGLDINMPRGTPLYAPLDFDDQWIFSADHRWIGVRQWDNGEVWGLQSHHIDGLREEIEEHTPMEAGVHYADAAARAVGSHPHSHFEFKIGETLLDPVEHDERPYGSEIDPWILFWQMFETDKAEKGEIRAIITPVGPVNTGEPTRFSAAESRPGEGAGALRHTWTFGDGGCSHDAEPEHTFTRPGVHPVTLVVEDGESRATQTHHVTVNGDPVDTSALALHVPDEVTFRERPVPAADVYGWPVTRIPHTLTFTATPGDQAPAAKHALLRNVGGGPLPAAEEPEIRYETEASGWLQARVHGWRDRQRMELAVDPEGLEPGAHEAIVHVDCPGALNSPQVLRVVAHVRPSPAASEVIVDDRDAEFHATPFFWVGHQIRIGGQLRGHNGRYLTNGGIADAGAIARFTPDLAAGRYEVLFHPATPFAESSFPVRIRHANGEETQQFAPKQRQTFSLGVYDFAEGAEGFVEISAEDAEGLVVVDAVIFRKQ